MSRVRVSIADLEFLEEWTATYDCSISDPSDEDLETEAFEEARRDRLVAWIKTEITKRQEEITVRDIMKVHKVSRKIAKKLYRRL